MPQQVFSPERPRRVRGGVYHITITASNGVSPNATQSFTLTVDQAPAITSGNPPGLHRGRCGFVHRDRLRATRRLPFAETGALPAGLTLNATTGALSGTPAANTGGVYTSPSPPVTEFRPMPAELHVDSGPGYGDHQRETATFTAGTAGSFTVSATG